ALTHRLPTPGQMQPPKMLLDIFPTELRKRLSGVSQEPLDEAPIPPRRSLSPPSHAHQKRRPFIERGQFNWPLPRFDIASYPTVALGFRRCIVTRVSWLSCAHGVNLLVK